MPPGEPSLARLAAARAAHSRRGRRADARFTLTLLGRPAAAFLPASGAAVNVVWRLRRAFELVAFLALSEGRWAADGAVFEALWPDTDPDVVARNLHPTVSDARRALAAAGGRKLSSIERRDGGFGLSREVLWRLDVDAFLADAELAGALLAAAPERALACGRRAWRRARGDLLEGREAAWIVARRETLGRRYRSLLRVVAEAALATGRSEEAMDAYRTLLVADPYDEAAHLALMEIHGRARRPDLVRRQFMRLEDLLRELDVEPRQASRERYLALVSRPAKDGAGW